LYKGIIPSQVLLAPNKIFEYLTCGLDVWYPQQMIGTDPYRTTTTFPKVVALDFTDMHEWTVAKAMDRAGLQFRSYTFSYEEALAPLLQQILD